MKYLTREWYVKVKLSYIDGSVHCSKLAEIFDESFYQAVYNTIRLFFPLKAVKRCAGIFHIPWESFHYYSV